MVHVRNSWCKLDWCGLPELTQCSIFIDKCNPDPDFYHIYILEILTHLIWGKSQNAKQASTGYLTAKTAFGMTIKCLAHLKATQNPHQVGVSILFIWVLDCVPFCFIHLILNDLVPPSFTELTTILMPQVLGETCWHQLWFLQTAF